MTKKDKSLILLISAGLVILWFCFSMASNLLAKVIFSNSNTYKALTENKDSWLNVSEPLKKENLKGRIILLDFWTYACVNCLHMIPELQKLENQFGDKLTIIGVHSGKFDNEKDLSSIRNAVLRYDIDHPVVNDADFGIWKNFGVNSWPTLILIGPNGSVEEVYQGEGNGEKIAKDVTKLIKKHRYSLNRDPLPISLERNKIVGHVLDFPSKLEYAKDFETKGITKTPALFIANSGKNNILAVSLKGEILLEIGSGKKGLADGKISSAMFNSPRGMLYEDGVLYVADTGNHSLRKIDFKKDEVSTLVGTGLRGKVLAEEMEAKKFDLASPWDLEFFPDNKNIIIANAGTHQLLKYNLSDGKIAPFAGTGIEELVDGTFPQNALAQPSALSVYNGKLYFLDSETSALRVADKKGNVETLIGSGLFNFGHKNGSKKEALMQHPIGLVVDDTGAYIADTHNSLIRRYSFGSSELSDYSGSGKKGVDNGYGIKTISYNEPEDIIEVLSKFYVADSNNNRILSINIGTNEVSVLDVLPPLKLPKQGMLEYLPNLSNLKDKTVKSDVNVSLLIALPKGWKINESAPSFVNLLELKNGEANLIASYDWNSVKSGEIKLPKLKDGDDYYLQGTLYYCEDKENALCLINSYSQKLISKKSSDTTSINVDFSTGK